ncbi:hypothetical protein DH2020_044460 [Rehmannia glutinosa]|uniref:RING-type E3 ubiquitin transferase n=1 Tax=Rehmannia glutinosa TaxID=99300 RepID=A0ABR0UHX3_REHGL
MQACRYGHWEVVQTLLLFRCNVTRADYLNGRTALHFAAVNGHVRCLRLVVADFVPSAPFESLKDQTICDRSDGSNNKTKYEQRFVGFSVFILTYSCSSKSRQIGEHSNALSKFVNKSADGGVTALHMAAMNGYFDCVQLLLDLHANVKAATFNYGTSMDLIGAGSTPLHYAACGGNLKCCQILLARGASRLSLNCNGDCGLKLSSTASDDAEVCAVCLERACNVAAEGCAHELCVRCALYLCSAINIPSDSSMPPGSIPCPLCRRGILYFVKTPGSSEHDMESPLSLGLCTPDTGNNGRDSVSSEIFCPVTCSPFSSVSIPIRSCNEGTCQNFDSGESHPQEETPRCSQPVSSEQERTEGMRLEKTTCSVMFWFRRRRNRDNQCNAE